MTIPEREVFDKTILKIGTSHLPLFGYPNLYKESTSGFEFRSVLHYRRSKGLLDTDSDPVGRRKYGPPNLISSPNGLPETAPLGLPELSP